MKRKTHIYTAELSFLSISELRGGILLPMTGAWTETLGAWALGLDKKKTMLVIIIGVLSAGIIVTTIMVLGAQGLEFFIKKG